MATVKIKRTSAGLKGALFEAIEALRAGDIDANEAKQIAGLAREITNVTRLEMDVFNYQMTLERDADEPIPAISLDPEDADVNVQALPSPASGDDDADKSQVSQGAAAD
ncbi:MAG: hypothetical protein ABFD96_14605 [Armatimonadia bacterium]